MKLLTEKEAAAILNISQRTLQHFRLNGDGPEFIRIGRAIRYSEEALALFIAERVMTNTSQRNAD